MALRLFIQNNGLFALNPEAITFLRTIQKPVKIVTIMGTYRKGKSFLLNLLLQQREIFKVSHGTDSCTKGIWISKNIYEENDCAYIFIDTEVRVSKLL